MSCRPIEAIRMADEGEIENAASVIALNWLARHHDEPARDGCLIRT